MTKQRIIAAGLLVVSLLLWPLIYWLMFLVPRMARTLSDVAEPLPGPTVLVITVSNACQRFSLLVLPLTLGVTAASAAWLVIALTRRKGMPTNGC